MQPKEVGLKLLSLPIPREGGMSALPFGSVKSGFHTPLPSSRTLEVPVPLIDNGTERPVSVFKQVSRRESTFRLQHAVEPKSRVSMNRQTPSSRVHDGEKEDDPHTKIKQTAIFFGEEPLDVRAAEDEMKSSRKNLSTQIDQQAHGFGALKRGNLPSRVFNFNIQANSKNNQLPKIPSLSINSSQVELNKSTKLLAPSPKMMRQTVSIKIAKRPWERSNESLVETARTTIHGSGIFKAVHAKKPGLLHTDVARSTFQSGFTSQRMFHPSASQLTSSSPRPSSDDQDGKVIAALETIHSSIVGSVKAKKYQEKEMQSLQIAYPSQLNLKKMPPAHVKDS